MSSIMPKIDTPKKPADLVDWHPAYIVYRLRLKGLSLRRLGRLNRYGSLATVMRLAWPKAERLIADAIGVTPNEIWPSRYDDDGSPKSGLHSRKRSTSSTQHNVESKRAA